MIWHRQSFNLSLTTESLNLLTNLGYSVSYNSYFLFTASIAQEAEGFGRFAPPEDLDDSKHDDKEDESDSEESNEFISSAKLRRNRISTKGN